MNLQWLSQSALPGNWLAQATWTWHSPGWSAPAWRFTWVDQQDSQRRSLACAIGDRPPYQYYRAYLLENGAWRLICENGNY